MLYSYVSNSGIKWMCSSATRQCDRALVGGRKAGGGGVGLTFEEVADEGAQAAGRAAGADAEAARQQDHQRLGTAGRGATQAPLRTFHS